MQESEFREFLRDSKIPVFKVRSQSGKSRNSEIPVALIGKVIIIISQNFMIGCEIQW